MTGDRTAVLVSGMHRSGTSALTRVIALLGAKLPGDLIEGREGDNESGFWESRTVVDVDNQMLALLGSWWGGWQSFRPGQMQDRPTLRERVRSFIGEQFADDDLIVLKDPRLSRLLPLWTSELEDAGFRCVHAVLVRDVGEVALSLEKRNALAAETSVLGWLAHMLDAEAGSAGSPRVFVDFRDLLADWRGQAERVGRALGVEWKRSLDEAAPEIEEFIDPSMAHRAAEEPAGPVAAVAPVSEQLRRLCRDEPVDADVLASWRQALAGVRRPASAVSYQLRQRRLATLRARSEDPVRADILNDRGFWLPIVNEGYNIEARAAWAWLTESLEHQQSSGGKRRWLSR